MCFVVRYNVFIVIILNSISQSQSTSGIITDELPETIVHVCNIRVGHSIKIECLLNEGEVLDFKYIRKWLEFQNVLSTNVYIVCVGGSLWIQWPFKSSKMKTLHIEGCVVEDILSKKDDSVQTVDMLENLHLIDLVFKIDSVKMRKLTQKLRRISPTHECGPKNIKSFIWRNVTAEFTPLIPDSIAPRVDAKQSCTFKETTVFENTLVKAGLGFSLEMLVGRTIFPNLQTLNLSFSEQTVIPHDLEPWHLHNPVLHILDLSHNLINGFSFNDYTINKTKRAYIDLRFNDIVTLGANEIQSFKDVQSALIDVRDNKIDCKCDSIPELHSLLHTYTAPKEAGLNKDYGYLWELQCATPLKFHGRVISTLSMEDICDSDPDDNIALISALSIIVFILLIIVILLTRYRKDIRILIHARIYVFLPCGKTPITDSKLYDAFISYSQEDSEWVTQTLLPRLEHETLGYQLKLCIRDRDCLIGSSTSEQIVACVENSRHTILILSNNFLRSEWRQFEFRTALSESVSGNRRHMIIVLLEDINMTNIDPDLKRCLKTRTYIKADDRLFWDRIRYTLTSNFK